jgi:hypothetical protein
MVCVDLWYANFDTNRSVWSLPHFGHVAEPGSFQLLTSVLNLFRQFRH